MPHVIVKLWPGKSPEQKRRLSDAIVESITGILGYGSESVSVGFEEVSSADWASQVYQPDIARKWPTLTKQPGYGPGPSDPADH
ncbi:MAG: tautomerase family protein [Novosphingobium sp.]